jgi:hypothetical protein
LTAARARELDRVSSHRNIPGTPRSTSSFRSVSNRSRPASRQTIITKPDLKPSDPTQNPDNVDIEKAIETEEISTKDGQISTPNTEIYTAVNGRGGSEKKKKPKLPFKQRTKRGTIRFWMHTKNALTHSWLNLLLIFVPIGITADFAHLSPAIIFAMNSVAIVPLAGLLAMATESVAGRLGDTWGALLNVSFGNAVELIIFIIALVKDEIRVVQAALLGSLLANLLLVCISMSS